MNCARRSLRCSVLTVALTLGIALAAPPVVPPALAAVDTTAWQAGRFMTDPAGLVRRSNIRLGKPITDPRHSMPLGNGTLGVGVWQAGGFTAQLNRADTLPGRKSPGWVTVPGLAKLTAAPDYRGYVDLYDGTMYQSGAGMTATTYVRADKDELIVDVTGADPNTVQTAQLNLWSPRAPQAQASGAIGTLAETWLDNVEAGATGKTFGSLAAITAGGRNVSAATVDSRTVRVNVTPNADGSFRVVVGSPSWTGGDAQAAASTLLGTDATAASSTLRAGHLDWWHQFWGRVGLMKLTSADGSADYLENLRTINLYTAAGANRGPRMGSHAGMADMYATQKDLRIWDPSAYWLWDYRQQVQANITSGAFDLNDSFFQTYRDNLQNLKNWTRDHAEGRPGICVPETMRFNGQGWENTLAGDRLVKCDTTAPSAWNVRTITSGAEVGLWVWQQYLTTGDRNFLEANYPLMAESARFLLAYATTSSDGKLQTFPSDAHEQQRDVHNPTTDIAAMMSLFPATVKAAQTLGTDADLVTQLNAAIPKIRPFPRTAISAPNTLLAPGDTAGGQDMITVSYDPSAPKLNEENIGLEPVWPYNVIGDASPLTELAKRTWHNRPKKMASDWSFDPLQAARLGLRAEVGSTLVGLTDKYQEFASGFNWWIREPVYDEQQSVVHASVNEMLVQSYDGLLRIAPAVPPGWDAEGTLSVHGGHKVSVQVHGGTVGTVGINAGSTGTITIRNPWPGQSVEVVNGNDGTRVVAPTTDAQFQIPVQKDASYLVQRTSAPVSGMTFSKLTGTAATKARTLAGPSNRSIGVKGPAHVGTIKGVAGSRCIDIPDYDNTNGKQLHIWDCHGQANQTWTFTDGTLQSMGKCMEVRGGSSSDITPVQIYDCNGTPAQQWSYNPDTGQFKALGKCLDAYYPGTDNGSKLIIYTCHTGNNQRWTVS